MDLALAMHVLLLVGFVLLPATVAYTALRRFLRSRSANRPYYAAMAGLSIICAIWVMLPMLAGHLPGLVALACAGSTLPIWLLLRAFCNLNTTGSRAT
ncbi:hypothetical protein SuNHUV7_28910 (plasmid) [Pseudoseohaeicola sp. NH-UV-7]